MSRAISVVFFSSCALIGCNSVLGIEEGNLRPDSGVNGDGSSILPMVDGAATEAAPPKTLDCAFVFAAHRTIADLSSQTGSERTYSDQLFAEAVPSASLVRLVAYHPGANLPFDLYAVETRDTGMTTKMAGEMVTPLDMRRTDPTTIGILATSTGPAGTNLNGYILVDSEGSTPKLVPAPSPNLGMVDQVTAMFLPEPMGDIAYAASARSSATQFDLLYGRGLVPGHQVLFSGPVAFATDPRAVVRIGASIHVLFGAPGGPGSGIATIVDGMPPKPSRSLGPPQFVLLSAATNPLGKLNVAFAEVGAGINLRIGQFDATQVSSFTAMDAPVAHQYQGLADVPYTTRPRWFGDSLVALGPTSAAANELTINWGEAHGYFQAQKKLLNAQRNGKIRTAAFAAEQQLGTLGGFIDVFWIETYQDDAGQAYDVLYYDQVRCL